MSKIVKNTLFTLIYLCVMFFILEVFSLGGLHYLKEKRNLKYVPRELKLTDEQKGVLGKFISQEPEYVAFDKDLGWTIKRNGRRDHFIANSQGIRSSKEYTFKNSGERTRIATFGDSFTHNDEVGNEDTWQSFMEAKSSQMEVLNFGVGGFGVDQAYLRYLKDGRKYNPDIVLIGFMQENYFRHVNVYRPFYIPKTGIPLAKPRFIIEEGDIRLIKNPVQDISVYEYLMTGNTEGIPLLCKHDYYCQRHPYRGQADVFAIVRLLKVLKQQYFSEKPDLLKGQIYNTDSEGYKVTRGLVDMFYEQVLEDGATPIIVVFPDIMTFKLKLEQDVKRHKNLLEHWKKRRYNYIDLTDHLSADKKELSGMFAKGGHYNAQGNRRVAQVLYTYVQTFQ